MELEELQCWILGQVQGLRLRRPVLRTVGQFLFNIEICKLDNDLLYSTYYLYNIFTYINLKSLGYLR
jgi:hypothetical protein